MDDIGKWENPNNFLSAFRCTTVENAQKFVENGEIKFNTPNLWVQLAIENGEGRGDRLEGTMATFHESDIPHLKQISLKYENHPGLIRMPLGKRMYLKNERSMSLPCFCFYMLKIDMFECPNVEGNHRLTTLVPPSYFRDFMNNLEPEQVGELPLKDRPAIIIIHNYKEFEKRLMKALIDLGLDEKEIKIIIMKYYDFGQYEEYGWWDFCRESPMELGIKDKRFKHQNEARVIVNTDKEKIKEVLKKPIKIGSLRDVADVKNIYLYEGMNVELTVEIGIR